ncbi:MAG: response regulator transcription factor [Caldilineales bacterium]|nr:response regulator transcription factor [Caldilineales bacterium]
MANEHIHVLLVEDDWAVRAALREYLGKRNMLVTEAASFEEALRAAELQRPDVAIIDIVLPERRDTQPQFDQNKGIEAAHMLRKSYPDVGIIFLSAYIDRGPEVIEMFTMGHNHIKYLLKGSKPQELLDAIQRMTEGTISLEIASGVQGQRFSTFDIALETLSPIERNAMLTALAGVELLSEPERRVFEQIGKCLTRRQAARALGLSPKTIGTHMDSIYEKLQLRKADDSLNQLPLLAKTHLLFKLRQTS